MELYIEEYKNYNNKYLKNIEKYINIHNKYLENINFKNVNDIDNQTNISIIISNKEGYVKYRNSDVFDNIIHLHIDCNHILTIFPKYLKTLIFGDKMISKISNIPDTVEYIKFGKLYNRVIEKYPNNLKYLVFGKHYNQKINELPPNLKCLVFGDNYNQIIDTFPQNLRYLLFGENYNQPIKYFPSNLKIIIFLNTLHIYPLPKLPQSLKYIRFGFYSVSIFPKINNLPIKIIYLHHHILDYLHHHILEYEQIKFPNTLKHILLRDSHIEEINLYNTQLKYMLFNNISNNKFNKIPHTVKYLTIESCDLKTLPELIQTRLIYFKFTNNSGDNLIPLLPNSLKYFTYYSWNHCPDLLNTKLRYINIQLYCETHILPKLPATIKYIVFDKQTTHKNIFKLNNEYNRLRKLKTISLNMCNINLSLFPSLKTIILKHHSIWQLIEMSKFKNNCFTIREKNAFRYEKYYSIIKKNLKPFMKYIIYNNQCFIPDEIYNYIYFNYNFTYNN